MYVCTRDHDVNKMSYAKFKKYLCEDMFKKFRG